jgi:acyl-CoA thioester hydrolase
VKFRVRFAETDQMGIAHHSAYVVWFEAGRVEWLREHGLSYRAIEEAGVSLAVSELQVRYRRPVYFDDELELATTLLEAKSRRVCFAYRLTSLGDKTSLAEGLTVHTPVNREGKAIRMPEAWLQQLQLHVQPPS